MAAPTTKFSAVKSERLRNQDLSKKGSFDEEILDLVNYINDAHFFSTTSSCSGRIIVICERTNNVKKKGCKWLFVSHKTVEPAAVENLLKDLDGDAVFKFEPFILHVQCYSLDDARLMHTAAVESGFRNSGITVGKTGKIMVAVRSTHGLEVPLSNGPQLLVSSQFISFLVQQANEKLQENSKRIARFYSNLKTRLDNLSLRMDSSSKVCRFCGRTNSKRLTQTVEVCSMADSECINSPHKSTSIEDGLVPLADTSNMPYTHERTRSNHEREPTEIESDIEIVDLFTES